jgi:hypothetical protein
MYLLNAAIITPMDFTPIIEAVRKIADCLEQMQFEQEGKTLKKKRKGRGWTPEQRAAQSAKQKARWMEVKSLQSKGKPQLMGRGMKPFGTFAGIPRKPLPTKPMDLHEFSKAKRPIKTVDPDGTDSSR